MFMFECAWDDFGRVCLCCISAIFVAADTRVCSPTRVQLRGHPEAYGVGAGVARGRCKGFVEGGSGGGVMFGGRVGDVVVTPCDLRSLEMALARIDTLL